MSDLWDTLLKQVKWTNVAKYDISAKSSGPDQTPHNVASHRGSRCLYYVQFMGHSALMGWMHTLLQLMLLTLTFLQIMQALIRCHMYKEWL